MWVTPNDPSVDKFDARVHSQNNWEWQLYITPCERFDISGLSLPFNWTDDDSILATRQDARGEDETFAK